MMCYQVLWEEYVRNIHLFLSGLGTRVGVDSTSHKLISIRHSVGTVSLCMIGIVCGI